MPGEVRKFEDAATRFFGGARYVRGVAVPGDIVVIGYVRPGRTVTGVVGAEFVESPTGVEVSYAVVDDDEPISNCKWLEISIGSKVLFLTVTYEDRMQERFLICPVAKQDSSLYLAFKGWQEWHKSIARLASCGVSHQMIELCGKIGRQFVWPAYCLVKALEKLVGRKGWVLPVLEQLSDPEWPSEELVEQVPILQNLDPATLHKMVKIARLLYEARRLAASTERDSYAVLQVSRDRMSVCVAAEWPGHHLTKLELRARGTRGPVRIEPVRVEPDRLGSACSFVYVAELGTVYAFYSDGTMHVSEVRERFSSSSRDVELSGARHMLHARLASQGAEYVMHILLEQIDLSYGWLTFCIARGVFAKQPDEAVALLGQLAVHAVSSPLDVWEIFADFPDVYGEAPSNLPAILRVSALVAEKLANEERRHKARQESQPSLAVPGPNPGAPTLVGEPKSDTPPESTVDYSQPPVEGQLAPHKMKGRTGRRSSNGVW